MRTVLAALLLLALGAPGAVGQRMPPPRERPSYLSPHNLDRLRSDQQAIPEYRGRPNPDGTVQPPVAPWPFLLYVVEGDTDGSKKLEARILVDARFLLATRAIKLVRITPEKALALPYLKGVELRDPALVVVDRKFQVVGAIADPKKFEERAILPLLDQAVTREYTIGLAAFLTDYYAILDGEEKLWVDEKRIAEIQARASSQSADRQAQMDAEATAMEERVEATRETLRDQEEELLARLRLKEAPKEALATTFGEGRSKRELTPEELEVIEAFREFSRHENPLVRAAAVEDLGALDSGPMVQFILDAARDVDARVVDAAGRALGRMKSDEALATMLGGLSAGDARSRRAAILGFSQVRRSYPAAVPSLVSLIRDGDPEIRRAVLMALSRQQDASATDAIIGALSDPVDALRVLAAQTLGEMRAAPAVPALLSRLTDSDWSLQKASAEALGKIRARESIAPLLEHFEKAQGIMIEILYQALVSVAGQDFGLDPALWRRWWDRYAETYELPSDEEVARKKALAAKAMERYRGPNRNTYHTIGTTSRRMLFVLDVSASMNDKIPIPPGTPEEEVARFPTRVKIEIAKNELIELLSSIDANVLFNIITFSDDARSWRDGLVGAGSRTTAIKHVSGLQAVQPTTSRKRGAGGTGEEQKTNHYAALRAAFGLTEEGGGEWKSRTDADTIFLVTDGTPTTGEIVDIDNLISTFTEINRTRGVVIHLIMFDQESARLMGPLALKNGGQVVVRGL